MRGIGLGLFAGVACVLSVVTSASAQTSEPSAVPPQAQDQSLVPSAPPAQPAPQAPAVTPPVDPAQALTDALSQVPTPKDAAPPKVAARFSFDRVNGAILRLDSVSGQLTVCSPRAAGWVCQAVPEDRAALEKEIGRLQTEVTALKEQVAALREPPPPRPPADIAPPPAEPKSTLKLPSHEDMERARAAIERAWRRLVDMINGFQKDMKG